MLFLTCIVLPAAYMCWRMLQQNGSPSVLNGLCSDETPDLLIHVMAGCKFSSATLYKAREWFVDWCGGTASPLICPRIWKNTRNWPTTKRISSKSITCTRTSWGSAGSGFRTVLASAAAGSGSVSATWGACPNCFENHWTGFWFEREVRKQGGTKWQDAKAYWAKRRVEPGFTEPEE